MSLSTPFIHRPIGTMLLTLGLALAGAVSFFLLPVAPLPQVDYPTISVSASLPGASPDTMAATVATPLERSLGAIAGVTEITSRSILGSTSITLQFDLNRNIDAAALDVQSALSVAQRQLPQEMTTPPSFRKVNPADAPVLLLEAYNLAMASILRAHLHVRDSLRVQVAMNATHLLLAPLLMRGLHGGGVGWDGLGLYGYALAMLASRVLGLVLHLRLWRLRMALVPAAGDWWRTPLDVLWPVLRIGLPGAAVEVVYRLAFMVSLASAARLGVAALATQAYTLQLLKYVLLVSMAIGWACEIMVGRLVGAGRFREADDLVNKGVRNGLLASGSLALMAALAAPWLMQAFTRDPAVIHSAQVLLGLSILLETGRVFNLILNGALRATGDALYPAVAAMASLVLVLGVGSLSLSLWLGLPGIWLAYAADEWLRGVLLLARWRWLGWIGHARSTRRRLRGSSAAAGD